MMILVHGNVYELWLNHKNGWNQDVFRERYNDVLDRYDYIVGDWGHNQLRLKGFFRASNSKATKETSIASLQDYLFEYCNFGCAYFVLEKMQHKALAAKEQDNEDAEPAESLHPDQYAGDDDDPEDDEQEITMNKGKSAHPNAEAADKTSNANRSRNRRRNRNRQRNRNDRKPQVQADQE